MEFRFDLDDVLREFRKTIERKYGCRLPLWGSEHKGKNAFELASIDPAILSNASSTRYYDVIKMRFNHPIIWTCSPECWHEYNKLWLDDHFRNGYDIRYFKTPKEKWQALENQCNLLLVEDYPEFPDYHRIVLIDEIYNKMVPASIRVKSPGDLEVIFNTFK